MRLGPEVTVNLAGVLEDIRCGTSDKKKKI
jgi:hypothetical protein